jgi:dephospho-CoA kinase
MKIIGLVGGVASGKSRVAAMLAELGAALIDADRVGHALLVEDAEVKNALRQRWGDAVFTEQGLIDRRAVAQRVFAPGPAGQADRRFLEEWLHPRIGKKLVEARDIFAAAGQPVVVLDAALNFEAGWQQLCDLIVFVDAPREVRLARARQRGWSEADFADREAAQWPVDEKRRAAHVVICNDGSEEQLRQAVQQLWGRFVAPAAADG